MSLCLTARPGLEAPRSPPSNADILPPTSSCDAIYKDAMPVTVVKDTILHQGRTYREKVFLCPGKSPLAALPNMKRHCQAEKGRVMVASPAVETTVRGRTVYRIVNPKHLLVVKSIDMVKRNLDLKRLGPHCDDPLREVECCLAVQNAVRAAPKAGSEAKAPEAPASSVVRLLGTMKNATHFFTVMEFAGPTIQQLLDSCPPGAMPSALKQRLFATAVRGIAEMNTAYGCHRDIKADNLCVCMDAACTSPTRPRVKVIDLGGAYRNAAGTLNVEGLVPAHDPFAPWQFVAPEVFQGCAYDGEKSDVWQLGILLMEMWKASTGKHTLGYNACKQPSHQCRLLFPPFSSPLLS